MPSSPTTQRPRHEALAQAFEHARALAAASPATGPGRSADDPRASNDTQVTVTIGKLEVRAQAAALEAPVKPRGPRRRPSSLDQYLRARSTGRGG